MAARNGAPPAALMHEAAHRNASRWQSAQVRVSTMAGPRGDEGGGGGGGGFWGPVTASVDWCEPNYALSPFVAEFWNTLSNLPPVLVGALGFWAAWRRRGRSGATLQPRAVALSYWTLIVVFVGSIVFHATLTYAGQLLDELPMIYGVLYLHDALTPGASRLARAGLAALAVGVSIVMFVLRHSPLPLQLSYGTFVVSLVVRSFYLDHTLRGRLRRHLLGISFVSYGSGFAAWLLDQHFCARVQHLHLHAWWHLLTGYGLYVWIQFLADFRLAVQREPSKQTRLAGVPGLPFVAARRALEEP